MTEQIKFKRLGVMLDASRNAVMKPETVKKYMDIMADLGYNCLMLYTEDTYEVDNQPYFGHNRGRYSQAELKELDSYAKEKGIELIPCIQTLAHVNPLFRWSTYNAIHDCNDIMLCGEEKTYKLIEDIFATLDKCFTTRIVNIGMDEAHMIGRGKYQDKHGYENRFDILLNHLNKVSEIAKKYNFELIMWGDMFFRLINGGSYYIDKEIVVDPKIKAMIPDNVNLIYWDYYSHDKTRYDKNIVAHNAIKEGAWFAGGVYTWTGFAPHNTFSMGANLAAITSCLEQKVDNVILTMWGDNGAECSKFSALPSLYYSAQLSRGITDMDTIKQGFKEKYGIKFDDFMAVDLTDTPNGAEGRVVNAEKYMLYNDCFMGMFDNMVQPDTAKGYALAAEKLQKYADNKDFGLVFDSLSKLCKVLEIKCDLGLRTLKAYEANDKAALKGLIADYDETISRLEDFYNAYEKQWMWENKPHGFDVQDIRIGGLIRRIKHGKARLSEYLNGEIDAIEELNEPRLDVMCRENDNSTITFNSWEKSVSANTVSGI